MLKVELSPGVFVGEGYPVYVIGEGGNNHQGNLEYAKHIADMVRIAGAQCIKFQKRSLKDLMTRDSENLNMNLLTLLDKRKVHIRKLSN